MKEESRIRKIPYNSTEIKSYLDSLGELNLESSYYLLILSGKYQSAKKQLLNRVQQKMGDFEEFDLRDVIALHENESYQRTDDLFRYIGETEKNILFRNGDVLAGEYTGFTYSSVRYATPQEKYLFTKMKNSERFYVIDIHEPENIDKTLERFAQAAVLFDEADSLFGKLFWKLKQIKVHGHTFANRRPETA